VAIARLQFCSERTGAQMIVHPTRSICPVLVYGCFGFFTIAATKLPSYVLPLMPAAAILVALSVERGTKGKGKRQNFFLFQLSGWLNVCSVGSGWGTLCIPLLGNDPAIPNLRSTFNNLVYLSWGGFGQLPQWLSCFSYCATAGVGFEC